MLTDFVYVTFLVGDEFIFKPGLDLNGYFQQIEASEKCAFS